MKICCRLFLVCTILMLTTAHTMADTFRTVGGEAVIEAENFTDTGGSIGEWVEMNGYMQSTDDDPPTANFNRNACRLDYVIDFREPGEYFLHLLTRADNHFQNGFFATLDGSHINYGGLHPTTGKRAGYIYVEKTGRWSWYTDGGGAEGRGLIVSVRVNEAGRKTLSIYRRDRESKIDQIWLTKHDSKIYKTGNLSLTDPSIFIDGNPPPPNPVPDPGGETHLFRPVTDAYLQGSVRRNNEQLRLGYNQNRVSYLKFNINDIPSQTINKATLRLRVKNDNGYGPMSVFLGDSNNWNERNLNTSNAPNPAGSAVATKNEIYEADAWYEFDVTGAVRGDGGVSFILKKTSPANDVAFGSKDCPRYQPELVITTSGSTPSQEITFTLINANTDQDQFELGNGAVINMRNVGHNLNIRADVDSRLNISRVRFFLDGQRLPDERGAPYALMGDDSGDYNSWTPSAGGHTLRAVAFNAAGAVAERSIQFTVRNTQPGPQEKFNKNRGDLLSLHYDHMPDPDDGHATVAARTVTGEHDIIPHVVSGTHSFPTNRANAAPGPYQEPAEAVMRATWENNWLNAHNDNENGQPNRGAVRQTAQKWLRTLNNGGHVWVAEGGPSDFTSYVLRYLHDQLSYRFRTPRRIHVVQHGAERCSPNGPSRLNEKWTLRSNLDYVQGNTDYEIIGNGNCLQERTGNDDFEPTANFKLQNSLSTRRQFMQIAENHPRYGAAWRAAFSFFNPVHRGNNTAITDHGPRLDFSDTVELMHILDIPVEDVGNCRDFLDTYLR